MADVGQCLACAPGLGYALTLARGRAHGLLLGLSRFESQPLVHSRVALPWCTSVRLVFQNACILRTTRWRARGRLCVRLRVLHGRGWVSEG